MRARALAAALGMPAAFSIRGGAAVRRTARDLGCRLVPDADPLRRAALVVVDDPHPGQRRSWTRRARRGGAATVTVHDRNERSDADLLVCGNVTNRRTQPPPRTLLGAEYYLLDAPFGGERGGRLTESGRARRILIALGGGAHVRSLAGALVAALRKRRPDLEIRVASGFAAGRLPALEGAQWVHAKSGLVRALGESDVAVVAGGVTLYEACALGVPAVALAVVPAQRAAIRAFARRGAVLDARRRSASRHVADAAAAHVVRLLEEPGRRLALARRARMLVDGKGAVRVAGCIRSLLGGESRG
jgi:spore coat polysaccharide biosynthesis predicted glycosyltransferase SpsG